MEIDTKKALNVLNPRRVWIPILFGLGIVFYMLYADEEMTVDQLKLIFEAKIPSVIVAGLVLLARDVGYMYRIRTITMKHLSWTDALFVIVLWEFASAVTPSVVGGTAVAVFILLRHGLTFGKSLAYVMLSAIMDNLFFITFAPLIILITNGSIFPETDVEIFGVDIALPTLFYISLVLIALYTLLMAYALFIKPRAFKWFLLRLTSLKFLRRWRVQAGVQGDEIILASAQLKGKPISYYTKIAIATTFIWSARYIMLNSLISAYTDMTVDDHLFTFGRQVVMWVVMLVSPTPGSSGIAEFMFKQFFVAMLSEYTIAISIFWRLMSYYLYLLIGVIFLPRWLIRKKKKENASAK